MSPPTSLCISMFLIALCVNLGLGATLGRKSRLASEKAVANGGLNPALWAFTIWAILYLTFVVGYVMWLRGGTQPLPWVFCATWLANVAWLLASCADQWTLALGLIFLYIAASLASLPQLRANPECGLSNNALGVLNVATASLTMWLVAAMLCNVQIVAPRYARVTKVAALPILILLALLMVFKSTDLSDFPGLMSIAIAFTIIWICLALEDQPFTALGTKHASNEVSAKLKRKQ